MPPPQLCEMQAARTRMTRYPTYPTQARASCTEMSCLPEHCVALCAVRRPGQNDAVGAVRQGKSQGKRETEQRSGERIGVACESANVCNKRAEASPARAEAQSAARRMGAGIVMGLLGRSRGPGKTIDHRGAPGEPEALENGPTGPPVEHRRRRRRKRPEGGMLQRLQHRGHSDVQTFIMQVIRTCGTLILLQGCNGLQSVVQPGIARH